MKKHSAIAVIAFILGTVALTAFQNCSGFSADLASSRVSGKALLGFDPNAPLTVDATTNIVVMEYATWFGPGGVGFSGIALPYTKTANMNGQGYDSTDQNVINTHMSQIENLGADALFVDLSNGMMCTYSQDLSQCDGPAENRADRKKFFQKIQGNAFNMYPGIQRSGSRLKIIPLLGADSDDVIKADSSGKIVMLKQFDAWLALMDQYPKLNVIYEGKPLIAVYLGPTSDIGANALWRQIQNLFNQNYAGRATLRFVNGEIGDQPSLWANPSESPSQLHQVSQDTPFWTWFDRYKADKGLFPSYVPSKHFSRNENFVVTPSTPGNGVLYTDPSGSGVGAWGNPNTGVYDPFAGVRRGGVNFKEMINLAIQVNPQFLFVNGWNAFNRTQDDGFDAETLRDIEPNSILGTTLYDQVKAEITRYRAAISMPRAGFIYSNGGIFIWNGVDAVCSIISPDQYYDDGGTVDTASLPSVGAIPSSIHQDGVCAVTVPKGFVFVQNSSAVIISNGQGHICGVSSPAHFNQLGGTGDVTALPHIPFVPSGIINDGTCIAAAPVATKPVTSTAPSGVTRVALYRMYKAGDRLYTLYQQEGIDAGYATEATFYLLTTPSGNSSPVYRCFTSMHFVSRDALCEGGTTENLLGYLYNTQVAGSSPLYRFFDPANGNLTLSNNSQEGAGSWTFDTMMGYTP